MLADDDGDDDGDGFGFSVTITACLFQPVLVSRRSPSKSDCTCRPLSDILSDFWPQLAFSVIKVLGRSWYSARMNEITDFDFQLIQYRPTCIITRWLTVLCSEIVHRTVRP